MTYSYKREVIAGAEVVARLEAAKISQVPKTPRGYESEQLCALQQSQARAGYLGAELVESIYGWSVRYNSGLQNFGIIFGSRRGNLDGTYEDAVAKAKAWQAQDPERRYVTRTTRVEA